MAQGNLRFKINWASLIVGRKFTIFALFYFVFEGNFQVPAPRGSLYLEEQFNGGFFALRVWGAYIWGRGGLIFGILWYAGFILVECLIITNVFISMHIIF